MARRWDLKCLLCGATPFEVSDSRGSGKSDLVVLQEHLMEDHGVSREALRAQQREPTLGGYLWRLPDGRPWLEAVEAP